MFTANQLQHRIEQAIASANLTGLPTELYDPISYVLALGGKRIRPTLLLMACDMFDGDIETAITPALGIEVFHNFTLLHDDIMDKAPLRRGQKTVHEKWNTNIAILSGDTMFVKACQLMMQVPSPYLKQVMELFHKTAIEVCEGQQLDMNFEKQENITIADYEHMISLKTAVLLAAALKTGALIAGADEKNTTYLYQFGHAIGIAFQLQDDILDVYGHADKFGKQVGGDILADKKTYLLLKALELEASSDNRELKNIIQKESDISSDTKVLKVTNIYNKLGVKELAEAEMQRWLAKGMAALELVSVPAEKKETLKMLAQQLLKRDN